MANLRGMQVMGVRSFGPEEGDRQTISFSKPLTLILGENGCGKTTLLEALKFALCDDLPPNADFGRSFLHDPNLSHTKDTRAQIRLQFSDNNKTQYLVIRSMQVQQKLKKLQFQRIDNCIQTIDKDGKTVEISGRCGDTNNTICSILGISKAILNNVIFCHQEDSSWPLDEGKKVKERFDAIFDATKYSKCFDHIKKLRSKYAVDIKMLERDVKYCFEIKAEYENKIQKLHNYEEKISEAKNKLIELETSLKPISKRLNEISIVENNFVELKSKKEMANMGLKNCLNQRNELLNLIQNVYEGSEDKLQDDIEMFSENLIKKDKLLAEENEMLENLKKLDAELSKKISLNDMKKSELMTLETQNQQKIGLRNKHLIHMGKLAEIVIPNSLDENDDNQVSELYPVIKEKLNSLQNNLKELISKADAEGKQLQRVIDHCRDALTRNKEAISNKKNDCESLNSQMKNVQKRIADANASKMKLDNMKEEMENAEKDFENVQNELNVDESEKEINFQEEEINKFEKDLEDLQSNITLLQQQNSKKNEINSQMEMLHSKQKSFNRIKNKNKDAMIQLIGNNLPEKNFKRTFLDCQNKLKDEVASLNKQLKELQDETSALVVGRIHQKKELDKKKKELQDGEEKLYNHCKSQNLEDVLNKIDSDINKLQDQKSELSSSEFVIKRFTDKLKTKDPCCPLCHRSFDSQQDVSDLLNDLNDKIRNVPNDMKVVTDKLSKLLPERDQIIGLRPINAQIKLLRNEEIPSLEKKIKETDDKLQEYREKIDDYMMILTEPESKLKTLENLISDMPLLDQFLSEITSTKSELAKLESEIEPENGNISLEEATSRQNSLKTEIFKHKTSVKFNQAKLKKHNDKLNKSRERKNKTKELYLQSQSKVQELVSLKSRFDELKENKLKAENDIETLKSASLELKNDFDVAEKKKKTSLENNENEIEKQRKHINNVDKMFNTLSEFNKEIEEHISKDVTGELQKLISISESLSINKERNYSCIQNKIDFISKVKEEISNQKADKRELEDNMKLKKSEREQKKFEKQIHDLDEKIGELNHTVLCNEKQTLIRLQNDSLLKKASTEGEIKQLQENVTQTKMELKQNQYKNINNQYRSKFYELHLLKTAEKDLKDYAFAMDCCLMKYHKDKMKNINASIRDMWRNIYRGNDIDYIEIKTDEIVSNTSSTNRRVYDYKVVQYRNDVEIDMRGRCSAGQKVLACLIIRMALAENFSHKFGVLALDEPTTNLDRENISSLCLALKEMITSRSHQNFMFIIITHDNEFLTSLGRSDKITHFYRVTRNQEGKSRLKKESMP